MTAASPAARWSGPALKQLLADIEEGLVDVVVVYKIDRLSRSLMDFSKLVEVFDRQGVTFVSRHPVLQHHDLDGAADAQHPALLRPVRARGHRRAGPGQDQGVAAEGHVDGRQRAASATSGREPEARGARARRDGGPIDVRALPADRLGDGAGAGAAGRGRADPKGRPFDKGYLYKCSATGPTSGSRSTRAPPTRASTRRSSTRTSGTRCTRSSPRTPAPGRRAPGRRRRRC